MNISMICFTIQGSITAECLKDGLAAQGHTVHVDTKSRYLPGSLKESTKSWAGRQFEDADALIFVGAAGIAVRSIAPYLENKQYDPAVLVVDERGTYAISLLSGHLGGANALAHLAAEILDCQPVITTATDLNGRFAVDVFAKENGCKILDLVSAKLVSAALLAGESVGFYSEIPCTGTVPEGLLLCDRDGMPEDGSQKPSVGIAVTAEKDCLPFEKTAVLVPPIYVMGIGCRRGREADAIQKAAMDCLDGLQLYPEAVSALASIDLKKEEEGILALSDAWGVPFLTYPEEDLLAVPGDFTPSAFVKKVTGVENVCERSAVLASGGGTLTAKKAAADGVTTALARKNGGIRF